MSSRSNNREFVEQQLDAMVKHAEALKIGMVDAERILRVNVLAVRGARGESD